MSSLQWEHIPASVPSRSPSGNVWFAVAMGLLGFIAGYMLFSFFH